MELLTTNNVWMMICTALVFFMHTGFAFLEIGLTRQKNTINILFKNIFIITVGLLLYYIGGFNLMYPGFAEGSAGIIDFAGFGIDPGDMQNSYTNADGSAYADGGYTWWTDFLFQGMFAATAATIVSGAVAERIVLILWLGWFGFNGGSVLSADPELTSLTLVTTCLAAAAGGVVAALVSFLKYKNLDLTMFLNGILGGLVGITAGADVMSPESAIIIGAIAGVIIVFAVELIDKLRLDDPVGAIAVHLACGIWGTLAVGIFSTNPDHTFLTQLIGVGCYAGICIVSSFLIIFIMKKTVGIRVSEREELQGLDKHEHGMSAYSDFRMNEH